MLYTIYAILCTASCIASILIPHDSKPQDPGDATVADTVFQSVPDTTEAPNTFSNGQAEIIQGVGYSVDPISDLYQPREIDIPFDRVSLFLVFFFPNVHRNWSLEVS